MKIGQIYYGNLIIKKNDKNDYSKLEKVTGSVDISENATLQADALTSIGGSVYIRENATLQADALTSIGCYVDIRENATFIKNKNLIVNDKNCPALETKVKTKKKNFESFLKNGYLYADNILAKIIEKKKNVYKIKICGQTNVSYCTQDGDIYSHGDTIKEAKDGLLYKISNRDTSKYKNYNLKTILTLKEAIEMYRVITGACELGTRYFVKSVLKDKKEKYTVQEVIDLTQGQYNHEKLVEFFKA
jgi:hypothetical protein